MFLFLFFKLFIIFTHTDALPAFEAKDHKIVNNPMEAHIVVEVTFA